MLELVRRAISQAHDTELNRLSAFPAPEWGFFNKVKRDDVSMRLYKLLSAHSELTDEGYHYWCDMEFTSEQLTPFSEDLRARVLQSAENYRLSREAKEAQKEAYKLYWHYRACVATTSFVSLWFERSVAALGNCAGGVWHIIKQVGIFFAYAWVLVVSKKKKACPYIMFQEPTKPQK